MSNEWKVLLEKYEENLQKANLIESKNKRKTMEMLSSCLDTINEDPGVFLEKYPNRKYDAAILAKRIGSLKFRLDKEATPQASTEDQTAREEAARKAQEEMKKRDALLDSVKKSLERADKLTKENKYDEAIAELNDAMKIAKENNLTEQKPMIDALIGQILEKSKSFNEKVDELLKWQKQLKVDQEARNFPGVVVDCENILSLGTQLRKPEIKSQYKPLLKEAQETNDWFEKLKREVNQLQTDGFALLENRKFLAAQKKYEEAAAKLAEAANKYPD